MVGVGIHSRAVWYMRVSATDSVENSAIINNFQAFGPTH